MCFAKSVQEAAARAGSGLCIYLLESETLLGSTQFYGSQIEEQDSTLDAYWEQCTMRDIFSQETIFKTLEALAAAPHGDIDQHDAYMIVDLIEWLQNNWDDERVEALERWYFNLFSSYGSKGPKKLESLKIALKDRLLRDWQQYTWLTDEQTAALCKSAYEKAFTIENNLRAFASKVLIHFLGVNWIKRAGLEKEAESVEALKMMLS